MMMEGASANTTTRNSSGPLAGLRALCEGYFRDLSWVDGCEVVTPGQMPALAQHLLVHQEHMTPRLRAHHGQPLRLEVRADRLDGEHYSRKIKLLVGDSGEVAEFGIMRIDLGCVPEGARAAILDRQTPLGDILVAHKVLTKVEPWAFLRFAAPCPVVGCLRRDDLRAACGRLATIHCNGQEAVELLEVVPT